MGDRANVYITDVDDSGVYLYTHWGGYKLLDVVRTALKRQERWSDGAYLARIVFCAMVGTDWKGTTEYGISATLGDNEHPIIVLSAKDQAIGLAHEGEEQSVTYVRQTFTEFIQGPGPLDQEWAGDREEMQ